MSLAEPRSATAAIRATGLVANRDVCNESLGAVAWVGVRRQLQVEIKRARTALALGPKNRMRTVSSTSTTSRAAAAKYAPIFAPGSARVLLSDCTSTISGGASRRRRSQAW
ncbi:MAG: hypothetical protein OHK0044_03130 [Burkholderiaceae bacterium]